MSPSEEIEMVSQPRRSRGRKLPGSLQRDVLDLPEPPHESGLHPSRVWFSYTAGAGLQGSSGCSREFRHLAKYPTSEVA